MARLVREGARSSGRPWALMLLVLVGCGTTLVKVGDPCADAKECPEGPSTACILAWPEGYCTEVDCALGSCAAGSRCVVGLQFASVTFDAFCLSTCTADTDCRDRYRCIDVQQAEKVCAPAMP